MSEPKLVYRLMTVEAASDAVMDVVPADPELHTYWISQAIKDLRAAGIYLVRADFEGVAYRSPREDVLNRLETATTQEEQN